MTTKYTREILAPIVAQSRSVKQVIETLGLKHSGGNHAHITRVISNYGLDRSHFLGQGWSKNRVARNRIKPSDYLIVYDSNKTVCVDGIKKRLFRDGIKEQRCEVCGGTQWLNHDIPLEIHHLDGNRWNNQLENLLIVCPNCHAQQ